MKSKINANDCEITITIKNKGTYIAQVSLQFDDLIIYGYRIMYSAKSESYFVTPPSLKTPSKYLWLVNIKSEAKWKQIEKRILKKYEEKLSESNKDEDSESEIETNDEEMEEYLNKELNIDVPLTNI